MVTSATKLTMAALARPVIPRGQRVNRSVQSKCGKPGDYGETMSDSFHVLFLVMVRGPARLPARTMPALYHQACCWE